jgi:hypothetical protein
MRRRGPAVLFSGLQADLHPLLWIRISPQQQCENAQAITPSHPPRAPLISRVRKEAIFERRVWSKQTAGSGVFHCFRRAVKPAAWYAPMDDAAPNMCMRTP